MAMFSLFTRLSAPVGTAAAAQGLRAFSEKAASSGTSAAGAKAASAAATAAPTESAFMKYINSPTGPKTTHFWGPVSNWGISIAAAKGVFNPPEKVSKRMTFALMIYSLLFMRFAIRVQPRNYILFACHGANETVQVYQMQRILGGKDLFYKPPQEDKQA